MSRWKLKTEAVALDDNKLIVRQLTHGERHAFAEAVKEDRKAGPMFLLVTCATHHDGSAITGADIADMPSDLAEAALDKIMSLSGMVKDEKKVSPTPS